MLHFVIERCGKVCKQLPIGCLKTKRIALYWSLNKLRQKAEKHLLNYCYNYFTMENKTSFKLDSFIIWFCDTFCRITYPYRIKLMWYPLSTSEWPWLRLNRQSFYRYWKQQIVPTDGYQFGSIGKLIRSVSIVQVAYWYLDTFPY